MNEQAVLLIARQRIQDALREAELLRALGPRHARRPAVRIRVGSALVRIGQWIMGSRRGMRYEESSQH